MDRLMSESCVMENSTDSENRLYPDDIWELLPTPPRSPDRPCSDDELDLLSHIQFEEMLDLMSDPLDTLEFAVWDPWPSSTAGLKNDLLHDCMWSGTCTDSCRRGHKSDMTSLTSFPTARSASPQETVELRLKQEPEVTRAVPSPTLPVDPFTMMPYTPLSDHSYHNQHQLTTCVQPPRTPPVCDTPSDTEDEIDVVTLPATVPLTSIKSELPDVKASEVTTTKRRPGRPRTVPPLRVVIRTSNVVSQHKDRRGHHSRKRFQKRLGGGTKARGFTSVSDSGWTQRRYKRHFTPHKHGNRTESCSSDSEDCLEKRSMHNSMERKRRDDLRFAFQTLREHVPDLACNPKAPKVLILNRAASYARQLSQTGAALEKALKQETRRKQELQRKLMQLSKMK